MVKISHHHGTSLLELIIALALIVIISNWTLGRYHHIIAVTRRHEAQQALLSLASALEEYALHHQHYRGATFRKLKQQQFVADQAYELRLTALHENKFVISAHPLKRQAIIDAACGILYLTHTGAKHHSGHAAVDECW